MTPPQTVIHARVVTGKGGGPEKTILNSARYLSATRFRSEPLYLHPPDDPGFEEVKRRALEAGTPLHGVPDKGPLDPSVVRQSLRLVRELNATIWHAHDYKSNLLGLLLNPWHRMARITTVHGWVEQTRRTPLYYAVDRWCLPRYDKVICVSEDLEARCLKLGVQEDCLTLIRNAIDEQQYQRSRPARDSKFRSQHAVPPGRLVFGGVGRLSDEKGFLDLIDAFAQTKGIDAELWIAGEGPQRPVLEERIRHHQLKDRVRLLGFVNDPQALFEALDGFILSSLREGLPNVVLEAAAMEVPIIATRVAGVPHALDHGTTALLLDPGDKKQLTKHITRLASDESLRLALARNGRALVEREFSFAARMTKVVALYEEISPS